MKHSKTDRRQVPVTDEPRPIDNPGGAPTADARDPESENDQDDPSATLQADLDRFRDLALRTQADLENFKKRAAREKEDSIKYANSSLLERLIAIIDNFELGLSAARSEGEKSPIYAGMSMVLKQLTDFLADNGLQPIDAAGEKFDPNLHEAIAHEPSNEVAEGIVIRQMRRGYRMKDRLLRPSSVVVSSGSA
ncbi:MAG: nucleotide exchange factor GrpE [Verrucomicrobiota bacterium]|nr:nucleotide exchange factor GrpE [Verrucomicrobiota bacterium]